MMPAFDHTVYKAVLFIDSMVALEAKPLAALPWKEIDPVGPILILVVPQVNTEVDKRKRDGRLGRRAREFNRLITPAAASGAPYRLSVGPPAVDIAIARPSRINWGELEDLDPDEGDARVVAQVLHTSDVPAERKLLLSHDINPLAMASRHGVSCKKLPDTWLLEPEPSPSEKELTRLKARVKELEAAEPALRFTLAFGIDAPSTIYQVEPLTPDERQFVTREVLQKNPRIRHERDPFTISLSSYDSGYDDSYSTFKSVSVPAYANSLHKLLELQYSQVPFRFEIVNDGAVQAEDLIISLQSTGGTLHDRFSVYPIFGPIAPKPQPFNPLRHAFKPMDLGLRKPERHEIHFVVGPDRGPNIEIHCGDFRHGRQWKFDGIATLDPYAKSPMSAIVTVTAANMRGSLHQSFNMTFHTEERNFDELVDITIKKHLVPFAMQERFDQAVAVKNLKWFDFVKSIDQENDDDE